MSKWLTFSALALIAAALFSQQNVVAQEQYVEGRDYAVIATPVRTSDPSKIEITEVFWYGCPHCNQFRPVFENWKKQQGDDIVVNHSPAMWRKNMVTHARIFYTAKVLGKQDVMHKDIFDAMHLQKKRLTNPKEIYSVFAKHDISQEKFEKTFKSFGVNSLVQQADARARSFGITGTPEVVINGKYRTSASLTGSQSKMLKVAEYLIQKERAEMAAKKS